MKLLAKRQFYPFPQNKLWASEAGFKIHQNLRMFVIPGVRKKKSIILYYINACALLQVFNYSLTHIFYCLCFSRLVLTFNNYMYVQDVKFIQIATKLQSTKTQFYIAINIHYINTYSMGQLTGEIYISTS